MFLEYDWTADCYRPRLGDTFTDINGWRSFPSLWDAKQELRRCGLKLGKRTDSRTWRIESAQEHNQKGR